MIGDALFLTKRSTILFNVLLKVLIKLLFRLHGYSNSIGQDHSSGDLRLKNDSAPVFKNLFATQSVASLEINELKNFWAHYMNDILVFGKKT